MKVRAIAVLCIAATAAVSHGATTIYWIGNSVTDALQYGDWEASAEGAGEQIEWGRHMIPGAPIGWIWDHASSGISEEPYGLYPNALGTYVWDVFSLQPYDWLLDSDIEDCGSFIELAMRNSPAIRLVIFGHYPRTGNIDDNGGTYQEAWVKPYTGGWDGTNEMRQYYELLADSLNARHTMSEPVAVVPVGEVYFELDKLMRAGQFPGKSDIVSAAYADGIHQNEFGNYIVGCCYFATIFKKSPAAFSASNYDGVSAEQERIIKNTVWSVVSTYPHAGVAGSVAARTPSRLRVHRSAPRAVSCRSFLFDGRLIDMPGRKARATPPVLLLTEQGGVRATIGTMR